MMWLQWALVVDVDDALAIWAIRYDSFSPETYPNCLVDCFRRLEPKIDDDSAWASSLLSCLPNSPPNGHLIYFVVAADSDSVCTVVCGSHLEPDVAAAAADAELFAVDAVC